MIKHFIFVAFTIFLALPKPYLQAQDEWDIADQKVVRLSPKAFTELPNKIVLELENRGCTIPQTFIARQPHNVIRGQFKKKGQRDWAILCSKDRVSSILIFWGGSEKAVTEIQASRDKGWLQGIGEDEIGFSRSITPVGKKYILEHYKWYGGPKPPPITHQGINEAFVEKASVVHYYYQGKWLELSGAD